jgi:hypothetical protein
MDPDPGGPKTCGSGSAALPLTIIIFYLKEAMNIIKIPVEND